MSGRPTQRLINLKVLQAAPTGSSCHWDQCFCPGLGCRRDQSCSPPRPEPPVLLMGKGWCQFRGWGCWPQSSQAGTFKRGQRRPRHKSNQAQDSLQQYWHAERERERAGFPAWAAAAKCRPGGISDWHEVLPTRACRKGRGRLGSLMQLMHPRSVAGLPRARGCCSQGLLWSPWRWKRHSPQEATASPVPIVPGETCCEGVWLKGQGGLRATLPVGEGLGCWEGPGLGLWSVSLRPSACRPGVRARRGGPSPGVPGQDQ